jgi:hypothetical protein
MQSASSEDDDGDDSGARSFWEKLFCPCKDDNTELNEEVKELPNEETGILKTIMHIEHAAADASVGAAARAAKIFHDVEHEAADYVEHEAIEVADDFHAAADASVGAATRAAKIFHDVEHEAADYVEHETMEVVDDFENLLQKTRHVHKIMHGIWRTHRKTETEGSYPPVSKAAQLASATGDHKKIARHFNSVEHYETYIMEKKVSDMSEHEKEVRRHLMIRQGEEKRRQSEETKRRQIARIHADELIKIEEARRARKQEGKG